MPTDRWTVHLPDPEAFTPAQLGAGGSVPAVLAALWAARPSAPALLVEGAAGGAGPGAGDHGPCGAAGRWSTAGELDEATRKAARALAAAGVAPGERLVWSAAPSPGSIAALVGALRLGAVVVPVNTACTERELAYVVGDVRPVAAVVDDASRAGWIARATPTVTVLSPELVPPAGASPAAAAGSRQPADADAVLDRVAGGDPALVVYTSGTTGAPKGAVLTHANLLAGARALVLAWRWDPEDRLVLALPLFHVHGLCAGLVGSLVAGASAVVLPRFAPEAVLDAAGSHRASLFFGVPTMYHRLLGSGRAPELAGLRLCVSGSAPLPATLWASLRERAGVTVLERYGMSETLLTVSNPYDGERRPGSVGLPLPGVEDRLVAGDPPDDAGNGPDGVGAGVGAGAEGELLVRGPSVFAGYWERPAATETAFEGDWFRTGDMVEVDADGYLSVRGRRHDLAITGGFNVYPAEVEDVLLTHPGVAEAAVAGVPSDEWGETVVAWIVPDGTAPPVESLERLCAERLAPYKRPRAYRVVASLPRNAMGKVQRDRLREA